ncbi:hypothetical protein J2Z21_009466 [Streptomyces griseochromogenes]|uniref:Uncharacterized protein n=1 Tax=Streptomyces griseochromogenes TaxID=68214 RepID=A0A1B1B040_9ACTN|nr:hypothetical protein [Streptomyces griseochromogenes]ANP52186.1 hypothetical protein AVL59_23850 [Streptomyces griseochromogenes]MBP2056448.1 hypothetical protein [Streptomyces griseochromogenes]
MRGHEDGNGGEELEAEPERARLALADAEEVLRRRVIGLEQYLEALAETDAPAVPSDDRSQGMKVRPAGPRRAVPHGQDAVGGEVLAVDYQALMTAAEQAGVDGIGARRAAVVLGWDSASHSPVEGARARLERLVERGWLLEDRAGRVALPSQVASWISRNSVWRPVPEAVGDHLAHGSR